MTRQIRASFDDQVVQLHRRSGISRYFVELVLRFSEDSSFQVRPVTHWQASENLHVRDSGLSTALPDVMRPLARRALREFHSLRGADLVHHTFYRPDRLEASRSALRVVTVFDMIPEVLPELFPEGNPHLAKREYVRRADLVLCISQSARDDLLSHYGLPTCPVLVTPLAAASTFRPGVHPPAGIPPVYVLFVGSRGGYKDFQVAVEAVRSVREEQPELLLVAVGGDALDEEEQRIPFLRQVTLDDRELSGAYSGAVCLVYPSRYEGFGLPVLEAMACECPVVVADTPIGREVGGQAAALFPVGDADALAERVRTLLDSRSERHARIVAGAAWSQRFTWRRTAELTAAAYHELTP